MIRRPALAAFCAALFVSSLAQAAGHVNVATIAGSINPASSDYLQSAISRSEEEGAAALLIELDTPGGLVSSTKDIIQAIMNSSVPVIVYVAPRGAWAGSAGTFITIAGHVAAMAPGTSIGAAHPVGVGGGGGGGGGGEQGEGQRDFAAEKAENFLAAFIETIANQRHRNVDWAVKAVRESVAITEDRALELNVIDLVARNRTELFEAIEGREVELAEGPHTLALVGAQQVEIPWSPLSRFLDVLATPDIAVLLILAGMMGLYLEFTNPGLFVPGIVGAVCLFLGFVSLQILPFSWMGLFLILSGLGLLVAEIFFTSFGLLFLSGVALLLLGGSMLFDLPEVSDLNVSFWSVLVPAVAALAVFGAVIVVAVGRGLRRPQTAGIHELVGLIGVATTTLDPEGTIFVRGEYWTAHADESIPQGEHVEVTAVEGMRLRVRRGGES